MEHIAEEVEVINSIYEGTAEYSKETSTVELQIPETAVSIRLWFPGDYPQQPPKVNKISGVKSREDSVQKIQKLVDESFVPGEVYMFTFMDVVREEIEDLEKWSQLDKAQSGAQEMLKNRAIKGSVRIGEWAKSDEYRDRGSVFTGRAIAASSEEDVKELVDDLLLDKKLADAAHNMVAWRIRLNEEGTQFALDCDNDGESGAGTTILHLLDSANVQNVVVVVTRVFNGTHIGSDRFKHIKNCARDALIKGGFINK